jgi:hypothetical protein
MVDSGFIVSLSLAWRELQLRLHSAERSDGPIPRMRDLWVQRARRGEATLTLSLAPRDRQAWVRPVQAYVATDTRGRRRRAFDGLLVRGLRELVQTDPSASDRHRRRSAQADPSCVARNIQICRSRLPGSGSPKSARCGRYPGIRLVVLGNDPLIEGMLSAACVPDACLGENTSHATRSTRPARVNESRGPTPPARSLLVLSASTERRL